jgi:hypothetical protein
MYVAMLLATIMIITVPSDVALIMRSAVIYDK